LFKIATQGVSLWHFHVCMYFNPKWLTPQSPSCGNSIGLKILYSFLFRKDINLIHLLNFFHLPSISCMWPSSLRDLFFTVLLYLY
jgi:hypothetical protein